MEKVALERSVDGSVFGCENPPYLEYKDSKYKRGKRYKGYRDISDTELLLQFEKSELCGTTFVRSTVTSVKEGETKFKVGDRIYAKRYCGRFFCPKCGSKGGAIEKQRKSRLKAVLSRKFKKNEMALQSFVFTVPKEFRVQFISRNRLNALNKLVETIAKDEFDNPYYFTSIHAFGDKCPGEFNPHINLEIVRNRSEVLFIPMEKLEKIKKLYAEGLSFMAGGKIEKVDVHYSFKNSNIKVNHLIKYLCRPIPDYEALMSMSRFMQKIFVVELKGFRYIRYSKNWGAIADQNEEIVSVWDSQGVKCEISFVGFDEVRLYKENEIKEISEGVYHCRSGGFG